MECLQNFLTHMKDTPLLKLCPLCRVKIDEDAIVKIEMVPAKAEDVFALNTNAPLNEE